MCCRKNRFPDKENVPGVCCANGNGNIVGLRNFIEKVFKLREGLGDRPAVLFENVLIVEHRASAGLCSRRGVDAPVVSGHEFHRGRAVIETEIDLIRQIHHQPLVNVGLIVGRGLAVRPEQIRAFVRLHRRLEEVVILITGLDGVFDLNVGVLFMEALDHSLERILKRGIVLPDHELAADLAGLTGSLGRGVCFGVFHRRGGRSVCAFSGQLDLFSRGTGSEGKYKNDRQKQCESLFRESFLLFHCLPFRSISSIPELLGKYHELLLEFLHYFLPFCAMCLFV